MAIASAVILVFVVGMALKSHRRPVVSGSEEMLGAKGYALETFATRGAVHVHGEIWTARTDRPVEKGQPICVAGRDGLELQVSPIEDEEVAS